MEYLSQAIAKVQIPRLSSSSVATTITTPRRHCIQLSSAAEFERIHSVFIR